MKGKQLIISQMSDVACHWLIVAQVIAQAVLHLQKVKAQVTQSTGHGLQNKIPFLPLQKGAFLRRHLYFPDRPFT